MKSFQTKIMFDAIKIDYSTFILSSLAKALSRFNFKFLFYLKLIENRNLDLWNTENMN